MQERRFPATVLPMSKNEIKNSTILFNLLPCPPASTVCRILQKSILMQSTVLQRQLLSEKRENPVFSDGLEVVVSYWLQACSRFSSKKFWPQHGVWILTPLRCCDCCNAWGKKKKKKEKESVESVSLVVWACSLTQSWRGKQSGLYWSARDVIGHSSIVMSKQQLGLSSDESQQVATGAVSSSREAARWWQL